MKVDWRLVRRTVLFVVLLVVAVPTLVWLAERRANPDIDSPLSGQAWLVRTVFEDGTPYSLFTFPGYLVFFAVTALGIGVVAIFTGAVSQRITGAVADRRAGTGVSSASGHLLVCGWNARGREIVASYHRGRPARRRRKVVLLADLDTCPPGVEGVEFVRGDPADDEDLRRAGAHRADTVVVLADRSTGADDSARDARTVLTVLSVEALNPSCHTVAEVVRPSSRALFDRARCDEVVDGPALAGGLLATSAAQPGVAALVVDLVGGGRAECFHSLDVPADLVGRPFGEVVLAVKDRDDVLVLGVARDGSVRVNPDGAERLTAGDRLLVLG